MEAYRTRSRVTRGTLHIEGLDALEGRDVEVVILARPEPGGRDARQRGDLPERKPGSAKGRIRVSSDFHLPLDPEAAEEFEK
jgi:hypothetical protein